MLIGVAGTKVVSALLPMQEISRVREILQEAAARWRA